VVAADEALGGRARRTGVDGVCGGFHDKAEAFVGVEPNMKGSRVVAEDVYVGQMEVEGTTISGKRDGARGHAAEGRRHVGPQRVGGGGGADGAKEQLRVPRERGVPDNIARRANVGDGGGGGGLRDSIDGEERQGWGEVGVVVVDGRGRLGGDGRYGRGRRGRGQRVGWQLVRNDGRGG